METLSIQNTSLRVSRLCAGAMGLGGGWAPETALTAEHERQARDFLDAALALGINFFDHADIYARSRAEAVFGRAMRQCSVSREQIVIQSKCGIRWANEPLGAPQRFDFSADYIIASVNGILERLGTEYLDVLLLHRPDVLWEGEEVARAFDQLRQSGKVRYFGVSNQNRFQMEYLQSLLPEPLVANQLQMSLLHHGFAEAGISFNQSAPNYPDGWEGVLEYCRLKGVSIQAWSPLDRGALTGDISRLSGAARKTAELVQSMARERGVAPEAVALAWLLRYPGRIVPVLGTTRPDRLAACAQSLQVDLSREEWYRLFETARGATMP